ncbi:Signal transduction histidine kinase CheA [Minicystis rosea]|nr:Signal transduction histidine kinase CheA [Minicystis rosea]
MRSLIGRQRRYRCLVDSGIFGVSVGWLDGRIDQANEAFVNMVGYTSADVRAGKLNWRDLTPREWDPVDDDAIARLRATGTTGRFEKEYVRKDGSRIAVLIGGAFLEDDASDRVIFFALDISAQKRAEAELARLNAVLENQVAERTRELALANRKLGESLALVDTLFQTAPIGLAFLDRDLCFVRMNDELARMNGAPATAFLGRRFGEALPGIEPDVIDHYRAVLATGRAIVNVEGNGERPSTPGVRTDFLASYYPVRLEGELLGVGAVVQDITERKRAEQELHDHKVRLELALSAARCGWFDWRVQEDVDVWARETEALYGLPPGGFGGTYEAWRRCVHPEDLPKIEKQIQRALETGELHFTYRVLWPDGTTRWLLERARILKDDGGRPVRVIGVDVDVTDLVEARQRVEGLATERGQLLEAAQRALRARDVFVAVASHELKTPLTPLRLSLQALRREHERAGAAGRWLPRLDLLLRQVDRLKSLVDALLDVARSSSAPMATRFLDTDITELVREVVARFASAAEQVRCAIRFHAEGAAVAEVDPPRIEQVVTNLLANALRYGAGKPITLSVSPGPTSVRLRVEDSGVGIAPEDQARIFGLFERAADERLYGGLGLGLYIARSIVEAHGGTLSCTSAAGAGAQFEVELPRHHPQTSSSS